MTEYELVAGIETHVQLKTNSKLFCGCPTRFGAPPNTNVCPICLGHPGVLPVLNRSAMELGIRGALALNCSIARRTKFDRKNYFYPDLPKNYQISQFDMPFSRDGYIELSSGNRIRILRAHLEEDAGKLIHEEGGSRSFVDLNRAGCPLIEIVTQPDIRSPEEAYEYLTVLKSILQYAGISECDMEKGELRCDVNLSIRPKGQTMLGVKTEVKNLNSFRYAKEALIYEFERQKKAMAAGEKIIQETRLYDNEKGVTKVMRTKEEAHDYRYFPEPDLPPVEIAPAWEEEIRSTLPEMPRVRAKRFESDYGLNEYDAQVLTDTRAMADFFEATAKGHKKPKKVANWISNDLNKVLHEKKIEIGNLALKPEHLLELIELSESGAISGSTARELLPELVDKPRSPKDIVEEKGLKQVSDTGAIEEIAKKICTENEKIVADFKGGKDSAIKALIGRIMKETKGKANPTVAEEALRKILQD